MIKAVWGGLVPWKRVRKVCAPECDGLLLVDATLVPALGPELSTTAQGDELPAVDLNPELRAVSPTGRADLQSPAGLPTV